VVSLAHTVVEIVRPIERRQQEASLELIVPVGLEDDESDSFVSVDEGMIRDAMGDGEFRAGAQDEESSEDSSDMSIDSDSDSDPSAIYDLHPEFGLTIGSCRSSRAAVDFSKRPWDDACENCKIGHACSKHDLAGHFILQVPFPMYAPIAVMEWNKFNGTVNTIVERAEQIHKVLAEKRREKVATADEFLAHGYITRGLLNLCAKQHPFVFVRVTSKLPPGPAVRE
jgi:hypothetical protein